ncbi:MAG: hypothetical protein WDN24_03770 [Sphingomonas sp.]
MTAGYAELAVPLSSPEGGLGDRPPRRLGRGSGASATAISARR